eukprot:TRINITY_DN261_c0_g1_i1.p1 TRINITY_DN261_c0_g1~~TRINITY_DN261_c0_g1_i1.p1  ORF type:complete len:374 (+),score=34.79 TRINITY_DN261_c0_g1_i1:75-1196(+)
MVKLDVLKDHFLLHASLIGAQVCFGLLNPVGKLGLESVHPMVFLFLRQVLSLPFLFVLMVANDATKTKSFPFFRFDNPPLSWRPMLHVFVLSFVGIFANQILFIIGLSLTTAVNTAVLLLCIPVVTTLSAIAICWEKITSFKILGIMVSVAGSLLVVEVENFEVSGDTFIGNLMILAMGVTYSFYLMYGKWISLTLTDTKPKPMTITFFMYLFSAIMVAALMPFFGGAWSEVPDYTATSWICIWVSVIIGTVVPYALLNWALAKGSVVIVSAYGVLELIVSVTAAIPILGEEPTLRVAMGAAAVVGGLVLVTYAKHRETVSEEQEKEKPTISPDAGEVTINGTDSEAFDEESQIGGPAPTQEQPASSAVTQPL